VLESLNDFPLYLFDISEHYNSLVKKNHLKKIYYENISEINAFKNL